MATRVKSVLTNVRMGVKGRRGMDKSGSRSSSKLSLNAAPCRRPLFRLTWQHEQRQKETQEHHFLCPRADGVHAGFQEAHHNMSFFLFRAPFEKQRHPMGWVGALLPPRNTLSRSHFTASLALQSRGGEVW
jgi:hypothetical protein